MSRRGSQPRDVQPLSDEEMKRQLVRLHERLTTHVRDLAAGRHSALDDLAVVLRVLMCAGAGNDALRRAWRRFELPAPDVEVSVPIKATGGVLFGFAALPLGELTRGEIASMKLSAWLGTTVLVCARLSKPTRSWSELVNDYANTNGAHLSRSTPDVLGQVAVNGVGGIDLGSYLLWIAAELAQRALQEILTALDLPLVGDMVAVRHVISSLWITDNQTAFTFEPNDGELITIDGSLLPGWNVPYLRFSTRLDGDGTYTLLFEP